MDNQLVIGSVMVIYITLLISWGIFQGRKVKTGSDYAIAGRNLPGWVAALSERATGESSWALLGLPGAAYAMGLTEVWTALGCVAGIVVAWALLALAVLGDIIEQGGLLLGKISYIEKRAEHIEVKG